MNYDFDAGPMMALLDEEDGADVVEDLLTEPGSLCFAHILNLMEVYYIYHRRHGFQGAEDAVQSLLIAGIVVRDDIDTAFWKEAATFKAVHPMSLCDAVCLALSIRLAGTMVTTDHREVDPIVPLGYCPILFIR